MEISERERVNTQIRANAVQQQSVRQKLSASTGELQTQQHRLHKASTQFKNVKKKIQNLSTKKLGSKQGQFELQALANQLENQKQKVVQTKVTLAKASKAHGELFNAVQILKHKGIALTTKKQAAEKLGLVFNEIHEADGIQDTINARRSILEHSNIETLETGELSDFTTLSNAESSVLRTDLTEQKSFFATVESFPTISDPNRSFTRNDDGNSKNSLKNDSEQEHQPGKSLNDFGSRIRNLNSWNRIEEQGVELQFEIAPGREVLVRVSGVKENLQIELQPTSTMDLARLARERTEILAAFEEAGISVGRLSIREQGQANHRSPAGLL